MYQNAPGPPVVYQPVPRRRPFIVLLLLPFLLVGLVFFCGSYAIEPDPEIEVLPGFAFVDAGGRDVLLVPYEHALELGRIGRGGAMTDEELVVEFALVRLDHPDLDLDEIAALVVRRMGTGHMLEFASRNLATRGELRGAAFPCAVEHVLRVMLTLRGPVD